MNPRNPNDHLNEEYYFVNDSNTFFSFKLIHTPSLSIFMIEGNLQSGENTVTSQTTTKEMASMNEAIAFIVQLAHQKTLEGYKFVDTSKRVQYKELSIKNDNIPEMPLEISSDPEEFSSPYNIPSKNPSSQTECLLMADNASRSQGKSVSDEFEVIESKENEQSKEDGQQENGSVEIWISSPLIEKSFKIQNLQKKDADLILNEATECELKYELIDDNIQVFGNQESIVKFHNWLDDFIKQGLCIEEEVKISQFHSANKEAILQKAEELNIKCDFRYYMMIISGLSQNINEFKNYLYQVEKSTKEALYPKYWDFKDTNMYSEIEVARACEEFEEITTLMVGTLTKDQVTRLVRIQNNDLMTRYITNILMHQEVSKEKFNRKLLFQDTKQAEPSKIYKKFDTGFDMQYSQEGSMFGKGLYFVQNTADSNSIEQAKRQLIFADVFVGKSHKGLDFKNTITPPEGYDSISLGNDLYILSNNFHSCPLYLVEYTMKNEINSLAPAFPMQIQDVASMPLEIIDIDYQVFLRERLMNFATSEKEDIDSQTSLPSENPPSRTKAADFFDPLRSSYLPNNSVNVGTTNKRSGSRQILSGRTENRPAIYNNMLGVLALNRIRRERQEIQSDKSIDYFFVGQPDETNLSKCIMYILGPPGSAYEGATFKIELTFPDNYPMNPPLVRFESQISHPSIDKAGNICLGILNQWTPAGSLKQLGLIISALLDNPSIEDPLMSDVSSEACKQTLPEDPVKRDVKLTKQTRAERLMELLKNK